MLKRLLILALCIATLVLCPTARASWGYYYKITVDHTQVGASDTSSFVVLVNLASDTNLKTVGNGGKVQNTASFNGQTVPADMGVFTDAACTTAVTGWDEASYSATTGQLQLWFGPVTLSHTVDGAYYLCFGDASKTTYQGGSVGAAWPSSLKMGLHLEGGTLSGNDASANGNNAGSITQTATTGQIGGAAASNGSTQNMTVTYASSLAVWTGNMTLDAWVYVASTSFYSVFIDTANRNLSFFYNPPNDYYIVIGGGDNDCSGSPTLGTGTWHHLVLSRTGLGTNQVNVYMDGTLACTYSRATVTNNSNDVVIGTNASGGGSAWNGRIDEVQLYNVGFTADQVTATHNMEKSGQTMVTLGSLTSLGGAAYTATVFDSLLGSDIASRVAGFSRASTSGGIGSEVSSRIAGFTRAPKDAAPDSDNASRLMASQRALTDVASGVEASSRIAGFPRASNDAVAVESDTSSRVVGLTRSPVDVAAGAEWSARLSAFSRTLFDAEPPWEVSIHGFLYARTVGEALITGDRASRVLGAQRIGSDTGVPFDAPSRLSAFARLLTDSGLPAELAARIHGFPRQSSDALLAAELSSRTLGFSRQTSDAAPSAEVAARAVSATRQFNDAVFGSDRATRTQGFVRMSASAAVAADMASAIQGGHVVTNFFRSASEMLLIMTPPPAIFVPDWYRRVYGLKPSPKTFIVPALPQRFFF